MERDEIEGKGKGEKGKRSTEKGQEWNENRVGGKGRYRKTAVRSVFRIWTQDQAPILTSHGITGVQTALPWRFTSTARCSNPPGPLPCSKVFTLCFRDFLGARESCLLPESGAQDAVLCCTVCDIDHDGQNEVLIGTYGQVRECALVFWVLVL